MKKFKTAPRVSADMGLNITAMADIFTVILVFLLMGFGGGALNVVPSAGVTLPSAAAEAKPVEALKVEISKGAVLVESKPIVTLTEARFASADLQNDGTSKSLSEALAFERKKQIAIAGGNADVSLDARIVLISDEKVPYATIKAVLASAAVQGFTDFKLAVAAKGQ